ncbi:MAG: MCP four helix bundle domain-containing protein, partial [Thiobacillus sp.]|nr:MCP four helix bundle domain-containing protein [Thiobacillus sp.]
MPLENMKIGARMGLGFGLVLVLMLLMAVLGLTRMSQIHGHLEDVASGHMVKLKLVSKMRDAMQTAAIAARNLVLLIDETSMAEEVERISEQRKIYAETGDKLAQMVQGKEERSLLARMAGVRAQTDPLLDKVMEFAMGNPIEATQLLVGEVRSAQGLWLESLENMAEFQEKGTATAVAESNAAYSSTRLLMLGLAAAALLLGAL